MRILIIEDELPASRRLEKLLLQLNPTFQIVDKLDSIESAVRWFNNNEHPEVIMMDIELADGQSFEIFNQVKIESPVIFTTAYDEFALKAFQVHSIDYLLKPIEETALQKAFAKLELLKSQFASTTAAIDIHQLIRTLTHSTEKKSRFLVKQGEKLISIPSESIAYFMSEEKLTFLITFEGKKYTLDDTLDLLENQVDNTQFFRLNRQFIANIKSIESIHNYFNGKLKLMLKPSVKEEVIVSREKAPLFKQWLDT